MGTHTPAPCRFDGLPHSWVTSQLPQPLPRRLFGSLGGHRAVEAAAALCKQNLSQGSPQGVSVTPSGRWGSLATSPSHTSSSFSPLTASSHSPPSAHCLPSPHSSQFPHSPPSPSFPSQCLLPSQPPFPSQPPTGSPPQSSLPLTTLHPLLFPHSPPSLPPQHPFSSQPLLPSSLPS